MEFLDFACFISGCIEGENNYHGVEISSCDFVLLFWSAFFWLALSKLTTNGSLPVVLGESVYCNFVLVSMLCKHVEELNGLSNIDCQHRIMYLGDCSRSHVCFLWP
jgi:hypothetical protein